MNHVWRASPDAEWGAHGSHIQRLYAAEPCCFNCSVRSLKAEINALIADLPEGAWEKAIKPLMVLPILRSISLLDPCRRLPLRWLHDFVALPEGKERVVLLYWELCRMVNLGPMAFKRNFFLSLHVKSLDIIHHIIRDDSPPNDSYWTLRERIYVLDGFDGIMVGIKDIVFRSSMGQRFNAESSAVYIWRTGRVHYANFLIEKMYSVVAPNPKSIMALDELQHALHAVQRKEAVKSMTLAMALHPRSKDALIGMLGSDLLQLCVQHTLPDPLVLWEDVLGMWLRPISFDEHDS